MVRIPERDRWFASLIWLTVCGFGADWCGLHFMVGAFLAGAVMDPTGSTRSTSTLCATTCCWSSCRCSSCQTGLRTNWQVGGAAVFVARGPLLAASVSGKLIGVHVAGRC